MFVLEGRPRIELALTGLDMRDWESREDGEAEVSSVGDGILALGQCSSLLRLEVQTLGSSDRSPFTTSVLLACLLVCCEFRFDVCQLVRLHDFNVFC